MTSPLEQTRLQEARAADFLRAHRSELASAVVQALEESQASRVGRYREVRELSLREGVERCLDALAVAIHLGEPPIFEDYATWYSALLRARDVDSRLVISLLKGIGKVSRQHCKGRFCEAIQEFLGEMDEGHLAESAFADEVSETLASEVGSRFLAAALSGNRRQALAAVEDAFEQGWSPIDLYEMFRRVLYRVGRLWELSQITSADEHLTTAVVQFAVGAVYDRTEWPKEVRGRVVVTGVEEELHQMGGLVVSNVLEIKGWDVRFLGTDLPAREILEAIEEHDPHVLGIACALSLNLKSALDLIERVEERFSDRDLAIVLGGRGCRRLEHMGPRVQICRARDLNEVADFFAPLV